ncbi:hypothetical protein [Neisseria dumasiana]|nr:hypothetical protein [Neisseria dumasiana]
MQPKPLTLFLTLPGGIQPQACAFREIWPSETSYFRKGQIMVQTA